MAFSDFRAKTGTKKDAMSARRLREQSLGPCPARGEACPARQPSRRTESADDRPRHGPASADSTRSRRDICGGSLPAAAFIVVQGHREATYGTIYVSTSGGRMRM